MWPIKRHFVFCCFLLFGIDNARSLFLENLVEENNANNGLLEMYIPTLRAQEGTCRNASMFYAEELRKYKLWAAEMFDATTKFPTGILYGSRYDFGHFDECMDLRIPYESKKMYGKYCLAKFTVNPPIDADTESKQGDTDVQRTSKYEVDDYISFYNISMWRKINDYLKEETRSFRNEFHFAFCIPSVCSKQDLDMSLKELVQEKFSNTSFQLDVEVERDTCQTDEPIKLDTGDILFIVFFGWLVSIVIASSFYDVYTKRDDFQRYKLAERPHQAVLCFSFPRNYRRLTSVTGNLEGLNCMAGMRVYSMFAILLLHRTMFSFGSAMYNPVFAERYFAKFELMWINNGPILVDTFFTISGFLATYLSLYNFYIKKSGLNVLVQYLHRYIRMAPTYAIVLAFYCTLLAKMGSGPLWEEIVTYEQEKCRKIWWANLLFINNYVDTNNYCMFQSWYMACDMNAFILVPIICLILSKNQKVGVSIIIALITAFSLTVFITVWVEEEDPIYLIYLNKLLRPAEYSTFTTVYIPGHMRAAPYFIGVLAAYLKYQLYVKNYKIPKYWVRIGWIMAVVLMFSSLHLGYIFYVQDVEPVYKALYAAFHHAGWSLAIAWMVIAISSGYGPWVESVLSWTPLIVLARLTYTVYVSHGIIQLISRGAARYPIYGSVVESIHSTAADIFLGWILAFILSMFIESPIIALEKVIFWKGSNGKNTINKPPQETTSELPTAH